MAKKKRKTETSQKRNCGFYVANDIFDNLCTSDYVSLDKNPEIFTACKRIAELISSLTIHLMENTNKGDVRIVNELSRLIDINPNKYMTRKTWMESIVMNMLLYGDGNAIVLPHTYEGYIQSLEPISASRVGFLPIGFRDYRILIDGNEKKPDGVLHFVYNVDKTYLWKGRGITVYLKDIANNLKQASATEKGFLESKWKPSLIVKVDAMIDEFSSKEGRQKLLEEYIKSSNVGEPWMIPAEQFEVEQVRPLSLSDLAIKDTVELDKRTVASIVGVPSFLLGVGEFNRNEWNNFVQHTIHPIAMSIQQELTQKLILNPKWYLKFNVFSLLDWDLSTLANVFGSLYDRGIVTGNEVRDRIGYDPIDSLDELHVLENYIPIEKIGDQSKLQGGE